MTEPLSRRDILTGVAAFAAASAMPDYAAALAPPSLEQILGLELMRQLDADYSLVDPSGRLKVSSAARSDLTAFMSNGSSMAAIAIRGPHDRDAIRAILLRGHGFGASAIACRQDKASNAVILTKADCRPSNLRNGASFMSATVV